MLLTKSDLSYLSALAAARRSSSPGAPGGSRPGARKGTGTDFAGHRAYAHGDDPRLIDWSASARTDALYVKEHREEVEAALTVLLDVSASMTAKSLAARRIAAAAGTVALLSGDRVKVTPFAGEKPLESRSFTTPHELEDLDHFLESRSSTSPRTVGAQHAARALLQSRRGRVLLISDFMEEVSCAPALIALRERGHSLTLAHLLSPEEASPPDGLFDLRDSESAEVRPTLVDPETRAAYARALEEFCAGWQTLAAGHGMKYVRLLSSQPLDHWADSVC